MKKIIIAMCIGVSVCAFSGEMSTADRQQMIFEKKVKEMIIQARKEWPDNYSMQAYQVKRQMEAYQEMVILSIKVNAEE